MPPDSSGFATAIRNELRRIGLDPNELTGLAGNGDPNDFLAELRALPTGSSWADVFHMPSDWSPNEPQPERSLGTFDHQGPPWGIAVFASLHSADPVRDGEAAIRRAEALGRPVHGTGVVLDRGNPHLYVVLALEATEDDAEAIADALRDGDGMGNAYPIVR